MATMPALAAAEGAVNADPVKDGVVATLSTRPLRRALDPAPAAGHCAIESAVQHDAEHRIDGAWRQPVGARDEVGGGVVDQHIERPLLPDALHHGLDLGRFAHVALLTGRHVPPVAACNSSTVACSTSGRRPQMTSSAPSSR